MILQSKIYPKQANYKFKTLIYDLFRASLGIIAIVMLLGWMGERDREAHVKLVREASVERCM